MIKFYSFKGYEKLDYKTKTQKYKWVGFFGHYLAKGYIHWTGGSYFTQVYITDLNWRDCKEDKHWYTYKRHFKKIWQAKRWCDFIIHNPPNYIEEIWGNRPLKKLNKQRT